MTHRERYEAYRKETECFLEQDLSDNRCPGQGAMAAALRYSALAGGKRIRPILVMEFCRLSGGDPTAALPFAAAVEMIHTYSLIHDDLPCMDNDDYRRGKLTSHKMFGEAIAVLAGDALLTRAFEIVTDPQYTGHIPAERVIASINELARGAGILGMIGGQVLDMEGERTPPDAQGLTTLHRLKTGALIRAAAKIGCIVGGAAPEQIRAADAYADSLGLAFQIRDDMLDVEGNADLMGKAVGADAAQGKGTFPLLVGMDTCRTLVEELTHQATCALSAFQDASFLSDLANQLACRNH